MYKSERAKETETEI